MGPTKVTEPTGPTQRKPKSHRVILLAIALLALNTLACNPWADFFEMIGCSFSPRGTFDQVADSTGQYAASSGSVHVWHEVGVTGVFTPTGGAGQAGFKLEGFDTDAIAVSDWEAMFDEVVEKGYMAIRVPHAPLTYTASTIVSPTVKFSYYSPPATTTKTTVPITVTRRTEYEPAVDARYPITDNQSHWEVWWIPEGTESPIPDEPFRLEGDEWPPPSAVEYGIDLVDADGLACAGCPLEYLFYNGYVFMGPFRTTIRFHGDVPGNPLVAFDVCYGVSEPTIMQGITPTVPFTHEHCLMNLDTTTRTYTLEWSSSENWNYAFYTQANEAGSVPVPLVGDQVTLGPYDSGWDQRDDEVRILAVLTPTITVSDTMRETFFITATSVVSDDVQAVAFSFALAPAYQLDESEGGVKVYLPLVLRNY